MLLRKVYVDGAANTPLDKSVFQAMKPYLKESFCGNSHAIHTDGIQAMNAVENARKKVAMGLKVSPKEVYFTSGATEGNNWVIQSLILNNANECRKNIVISATEHSSILSQIPIIEKMGMEVILVKPQKTGKIDIKEFKQAITKNTLLVCLMAVNNETGILNNINYIGQDAHQKGALMLADCTQLFSYGGEYMSLKHYPYVDYFTFSGHKIYGPTGTGCLIVRTNKPIYPFLAGGAQERGKRGGTHNVAGIVGLGEAVKILSQNFYQNHYNRLFDRFMEGIKVINSNMTRPLKLNAEPTIKSIINLNCSVFTQCDDVASLLCLYGVECSSSSACDIHDGSLEKRKPSHVLIAMGVPEEEIRRSVRLSFTKYTTEKDINYVLKVLTVIASQYSNKREK